MTHLVVAVAVFGITLGVFLGVYYGTTTSRRHYFRTLRRLEEEHTYLQDEVQRLRYLVDKKNREAHKDTAATEMYMIQELP